MDIGKVLRVDPENRVEVLLLAREQETTGGRPEGRVAIFRVCAELERGTTMETSIRQLFDEALAAAEQFCKAVPEVAAFQGWPSDIEWASKAPVAIPAIDLVTSDPGREADGTAADGETRRLQHAIMAIAPHAEWRLTYTEEEVGADFLNRFGWFELVGPDGHFRSSQTRMTIGYWGDNLHYPWHEHQPEELYCILSGEAAFMAKGEPDCIVSAGQTKLHKVLQPHAMTTTDQPILCFVLWRGEGLADDPRMSA